MSTYLLVAVLRIALVLWIRRSPPLDAAGEPFPAEFIKMAHIGTMIDSLNAINMVFSFFKVFKYFRHSTKLAQFTDTCAQSVPDCAVLLFILGVELFGFAVAFFVGYGGSMEEYKDLSSSFTTLFDTLLGASDISGLVDHDYVLVTLLFFPFVMMNTFVVLSMFLTVIGLSFDDVRDRVLDRLAEAKEAGNEHEQTPFVVDLMCCYDVLVHNLCRCPRRGAPITPVVNDDDDDAELKRDDAAISRAANWCGGHCTSTLRHTNTSMGGVRVSFETLARDDHASRNKPTNSK